MSNLLSILSSIYDTKFNTNETELSEYPTPSTKSLSTRYTESLPVDKKEYKEEPVKEITCNIHRIDKTVSEINFIMDEPTVLKIIEYRKLEIVKKLEIFKLNIVLFSNLCIHIKLARQKKYAEKSLHDLLEKKQTIERYIRNFILNPNRNYLLKCKEDIVFLEEQLISKAETYVKN
jgi:hypothetical protein